MLKYINPTDCIDYYFEKKISKSNEYEIKLYEECIISPHASLLEHQDGMVIDIKDYEDPNKGKLIVKKEAIERFHPNNINNKSFWEYAKKKFPKFSVCGAPSKTIEECNEKTLGIPLHNGFIDFIDKIIKDNNTKINFFEVGYGHGNIFNRYKNRVNYLGIDFYKIKKLSKYDNLVVINESGIGTLIKDESQDIIYSVNVLQHCSQLDRFNYYKEIYNKLKVGGYFFGTCFLETEENKDEDCWGVEGEDGRKYCNFFNQLTEVDTMMEFKDIMTSIGYYAIKIGFTNVNSFSFIVKKL